MSAITFDTFKFVDRLEKAGLSREQASAISEAQKDSLSEALDTTLSTKNDITDVRRDITDLRKDMETMELRLTVKLGAFIAAAVGILIAVLKFPH